MDFKENILKFLSSDEYQKLIESFADKSMHAVLLNTDFINDEDFITLFPNVTKHPVVEHAFIYNKDEYDLGKTIWHELGYFYLQEPSAMVVASLINVKENDLILDLCAAPGGKTIQTAFRLKQNGTIIANDLSKQRAQIISNNVERLGIKNVVITNNNFELIYKNYINTFDKVILDAPCSGSGMFRKDQKMIDDWSYNKVLKYSETQKNLISICYQMLKPGGVLCYSTCSYSVEEDEDVIHFLMDTTDCELVDMPNIGYKRANPIGIRLMPSVFPGEGQYICLIKKPGVLLVNNFKRINSYQHILPKQCQEMNITKFGDAYFVNDYFINLPNLSIIRYGVKIGEYLKNVMHYDLHYARANYGNDFPHIELSLDEVKKYLSGNTINHPSDYKGIIILTHKNNPIDITKTDGSIIKNHYPKGLRKNYN